MTRTSPGPDDEDALPAIATADAATEASQGAAFVAGSAAATATAAQSLQASARSVVGAARSMTAQTVAAAASAAAEIAAREASAVKDEATSRAATVAASAVLALEAVAADLPEDIDPDAARRIAAAVAATVAAEVIAQTQLTDDAAVRVAKAVALAAEAAALAALAAAAVVEVAASIAEASAHQVTRSSALTESASGALVHSTSRVAELTQTRLSMLRRAPLVVDLRRALWADELRLHYQPMYSMGTGGLVAVEALLRWQHPTRGLLPPSQFLDVAEGPHLVTPIGDWVIETAMGQAAAWQDVHGDEAPRVWVNISVDQLGRGHLVEVVDTLLTKTGLHRGKFGLELTERQLATRIDDVVSDLLMLRGLGVPLAVDDFGTGYASLDYLRRFLFDEIKIDRSFVSGLQDRMNDAVTASIVALGRSLDLTVVAEGVETRQQYDRVKELGCDVSQGYLMHKPAPPQDISKLLAARRRHGITITADPR